MGSFSVNTTIDAPVEAVWAALADIGAIYRWNPGVQDSHVTSDAESGLNATRYCDLGGRNYLDEQVVRFDENRHLTMRITGTNLPFAAADIHFNLQPNGDRTVVEVAPDYRLKFGPLGSLMDRFYVRRTYAKGMASLLAGLKAYVENGE